MRVRRGLQARACAPAPCRSSPLTVRLCLEARRAGRAPRDPDAGLGLSLCVACAGRQLRRSCLHLDTWRQGSDFQTNMRLMHSGSLLQFV